MQKRKLIVMVLILSIFVAANGFSGDFSLTSRQVSAGKILFMEQVLNGFGCSGGNISPELIWAGEPTGTKSFAVTVYDPDAPTGSGWWHWIVFDIPASVHSLAKNSGNITAGLLPAGAIQSRTDFGKTGYGGACPPENDAAHHYEFTVWALDVDSLGLAENASGAMVGFFLHHHQLGHTVLTALFNR